MSTIRIVQPHSLARDEARARMAGFETEVARYGVKLVWNGDHAEIKGTGVSGKVAIGDADIRLHLTLGLLAKAAGVDPVRLEGTLTRRLKDAIEQWETSIRLWNALAPPDIDQAEVAKVQKKLESGRVRQAKEQAPRKNQQ